MTPRANLLAITLEKLGKVPFLAMTMKFAQLKGKRETEDKCIFHNLG